LALYRRFGKEMDIDWRFLAAIGGQESNHGRVPGTNLVNHAGCVGPMQIGVGGRCGNFLAAFGIDGNGDGRIEPRNPADAIATAAWGLRVGKGAPAASGGQTGTYYKAACGYYGACADQWVDYANEVMARARRYGLRAGE
jgi:membrane-bound lytic murein transglycosylase B